MAAPWFPIHYFRQFLARTYLSNGTIANDLE